MDPPNPSTPRAGWGRAALVLGLVAALWATEATMDQTPRSPGAPTGRGGPDDLPARLAERVAALCAYPDRSWGRPEALAAAAGSIGASWADLGYRVERQPIPGLDGPYVNLLAFPPGRGWEGRPHLVVAHYDTVAGTPGADDNGSGVAVLLEVSRALAGVPGLPVVFAAVTLEEPPFFDTERQGSWVLASSLRRAGVRLAGVVVLEMVGYYRDAPGSQAYPFPVGRLGYPDRGSFAGLVANRASRRLLAPLAGHLRAAGLPAETLAVPGRGRLLPAVRLSDHAPFWDLGYPAVMVTDTAFFRNPHYHGPGDTPDTLDYRAMARLTRGLAAFLSARGSPPPRRAPDRRAAPRAGLNRPGACATVPGRFAPNSP